VTTQLQLINIIIIIIIIIIWLHQTLPTTRMGVHEWIRCRDAWLSSTMGYG